MSLTRSRVSNRSLDEGGAGARKRLETLPGSNVDDAKFGELRARIAQLDDDDDDDDDENGDAEENEKAKAQLRASTRPASLNFRRRSSSQVSPLCP